MVHKRKAPPQLRRREINATMIARLKALDEADRQVFAAIAGFIVLFGAAYGAMALLVAVFY